MRTMFFVCVFTTALFAVDAPFTVKETMNQARTGEPVTCGVAFKKGEVSDLSQLALFADGTEIPAQFSRLVRFEDGSYQWVLCDFSDDFTANQEKQYLVRTQAPSAAPADDITVSRSGSVVTVSNGALSFQIDTLSFKGIQSLVYNSRTLINGTDGGLFMRDEVGDTSCWNGPVTKAGFVYLGNLRATLRVEGEFYSDTCGGLGYSYMVTTWAGSPRVKIELQLRNSINPDCGRMAKIRRFYAAFPLDFTPADTLRFDSTVCFPGAYYYYHCLASKSSRLLSGYQDAAGGLMVSQRWAGGLYAPWLHESRISNGMLEAEIIRGDDSIGSVCTTPHSWGGTAWGCSGYQIDSATGGDTIYKLLDMGDLNNEIWLECYSGTKSAGAMQAHSGRLRGRLIGRMDPAYLSETGALSAGRFGTLEDEVASYGKWGWSFTEAQKPQAMWATGDNGPVQGPEAEKTWEEIHAESETDDAAGYILQWVRTGHPEFFYQAEAWARYYKTHYAYRTHGFEHDGQYATGLGTPAVRRSAAVPGTPGAWNGDASWNAGRVDINGWYNGVYCHFYGEGLLDYFCMTGDIDALEGGMDLGETAWAFDHSRGDTLNSHASAERGLGRRLLVYTRLYEMLRNSESFKRAEFVFNLLFKSKTRDPRGIIGYANSYYGGQIASRAPDSLKAYMTANGIILVSNDTGSTCGWGASKGADTWPLVTGTGMMTSYALRAAERFYEVTGNEEALDWIVGTGDYTGLINPPCGIFPYNAEILDFPEKGMVLLEMGAFNWDSTHNKCRLPDGSLNHGTTAGSRAVHSGWYTVFFTGIAALGYRYTGQTEMLKRAYTYWDMGSKAGYNLDYLLKPEKEVASFAFHFAPKDDGLSNTSQLFYETIHHTDTIAPPSVTDLSVSRLSGNTGLVFTWSAPAGAASYQLKYFKDLRIVEYRDYDYWRDKDSIAPWWFVDNVSGEPLPAATGSLENFTLGKTFPTDSVYYAALCSRDAAGNLSPLSNVVRIDNTIAVEKAGEALIKAGFSIYPNPFNPVVTIRLPAGAFPSNVSIFNIAGKKVWQRQSEAGKASVISWNAKGMPSGAYFVKWTAGKKALVKTITLVR